MTTRTHPFPSTAAPRQIVIHKWHVAVAIVVIALLIGTIHSREFTKVQVEAASPVYEDIESDISAAGTVVPVNDFPGRANFGGMVEKIFVKQGQKVRAGQLLIEMKDQYARVRVANARAALDAAEVNQENVGMSGSQEDRIVFSGELLKARTEQSAAASALATLRQLAAKGSVSESELAAGARRLQAANAALNTLMERTTARYSKTDAASWKARVDAEKASLAAEEVSYANAHIRSPIDGTVYELPVSRYDFVPAGADLVRVADLSKLRIYAEFYELDVPKLRAGEPVKITWAGNPHREWHGRVVETPLAVMGQGIARTGRATITIDDERGDLPVNSNVTVSVTIARDAHVLTVPREALRTDGPAFYVYCVVGDRLVKTPVEPGIIDPLRAEIAKGIGTRDVVVLHPTGDEKLREGLRVATAN